MKRFSARDTREKRLHRSFFVEQASELVIITDDGLNVGELIMTA